MAAIFVTETLKLTLPAKNARRLIRGDITASRLSWGIRPEDISTETVRADCADAY